MNSLLHRAGGSLAVKTLPALYGAGLILLVVRAIPLADFGRYGMAIAYVNLAMALSRGLWGVPLVLCAARGERAQRLAPAFWMTGLTALVCSGLGMIILPLVGAGFKLALIGAAILIVLVPRDIASLLTQATQRVWAAFIIEAGYFIGALIGFVLLTVVGRMHTAEAVMLANLGAAVISCVLAVSLEPCVLRPGTRGDWKGTARVGRWAGTLALGEVYLQQGDSLLLGIFFQAQAIAPYIAARTILRMYTLLSQAVNFLVLPSASRLYADGRVLHLRRRLRTILRTLLLLLVPFNIFMWFACPTLFPLFLGEKYASAVPFFRLIIVVTFFEPICSVLTNAVVGIGKPQRVVPIQLIGLALNTAANLVLLPLAGLKAAAGVLIATYGVMAAGMIRLARSNLVPDETSPPSPPS
jgi:O-antigen/teichoic acid export membrane protein